MTICVHVVLLSGRQARDEVLLVPSPRVLRLLHLLPSLSSIHLILEFLFNIVSMFKWWSCRVFAPPLLTPRAAWRSWIYGEWVMGNPSSSRNS